MLKVGMSEVRMSESWTHRGPWTIDRKPNKWEVRMSESWTHHGPWTIDRKPNKWEVRMSESWTHHGPWTIDYQLPTENPTSQKWEIKKAHQAFSLLSA